MLKLDRALLKFADKVVLRDISLTVKPKEFTTILGPSGCGKSTLLRVLAQLLPLNAGILSGSEAIVNSMSMVFQEAQLLPWRNVRSNVELSLELRGGDSENVDALLTKVGLSDVGDHYPDQLSGGMKMRVSLARALVGRPQVLFMDEPFGALDEITRRQMGEEVLSFRQWWSSTVIMVTHSIEEALYLSDRILVMPLQPGPWVLDHQVQVESERNANWKRQESFHSQVEMLRTAIHQAMGQEGVNV